LLPYDPVVKTKNRLKDGLKEYLLLLSAVEQMVSSFRARDWKSFDPLVGENACQIRAIKLATIVLKSNFDMEGLLERVSFAKQLFEETLFNFAKVNSKKTSLQDFLDQDFAEVFLSEDQYFLVMSYILTRTKVSKSFDPEKALVLNERTDAKKIKDIYPVGVAFTSSFITSLRGKLSESSVIFVKNLAKQKNQESEVSNVLENYGVVHRGLHCLPCYWSTKVLLDHALNSRLPIALVACQKAEDRNFEEVQNVTLFFKVTPDGYVQVEKDSLDPRTPALVLLGSACDKLSSLTSKEDWVRGLLKYGPVDLFLGYAAAHLQYPDETIDSLVSSLNDASYDYYKTKADKWGCSLKRPSLFFLAHAFCDEIGNI